MADPEQDPEPIPVPPPKPKRRLALAVVVGLVLLAAVSVGAYFVMQPGPPAKAAESGSGPGETLALDTFVVNLSGPDERAYLRVGIALGLSRPLPRNKEEIPVALVRDAILTVLSTARAEQLVQPEGKRQLKGEILQALKERAPQLGVEDVYFTEFLVQM